MAAMAAVNRPPPPAHPGPDVGNLQSCGSGASPMLNSGPQDPGLHGTSQDPGPPTHPQHHIPARPVFCVHAPPPPPFLHYQWPMPFYNPFAGFPGMGYGVVMPPFPPPPYMEAPAYVLPHPHIQPVDYRRFLHPQVHAPSAALQNPNQTRRIRPSRTVAVRATVNCEVQTEPLRRGSDGEGSPLVSSDSGQGTTPSSPTFLSSSKQRPAGVENNSSPGNTAGEDFQDDGTCTSGLAKHGFILPHSSGMTTVQSHVRATLEAKTTSKEPVDQENVAPYRNVLCDMWSVSTPDSMNPVCSSSQQEVELVKDRRISVPDILMSWGGGTPQAAMLEKADKVPPQSEDQLPSYRAEAEPEIAVYQSPAEKAGPAEAEDLVSKVSDPFFKIIKMPFALHESLLESRGENEAAGSVGSVQRSLAHGEELLHSPDASQMLRDAQQEHANETSLLEASADATAGHTSAGTCHTKRRLNESVWSVESLAPFVPTKEWLMQNGMFEAEMIVETTEEDENQDGKATMSIRRLSSSESVPMSDSCLVFSTPTDTRNPQKNPEVEKETNTFETTGKELSAFLQSKTVLSPPHEEDENGSSEPAADQSPNQESCIVTEQQVENLCSPECEEMISSTSSTVAEKVLPAGQLTRREAEDGVCGDDEGCRLRNQQLCVPAADRRMMEVSPSKAHLVDCGTQCDQFKERKCSCVNLPTNSGPNDVKKLNYGKAEGLNGNGHVQRNQKKRNWRHRRQDERSRRSTMDAVTGLN